LQRNSSKFVTQRGLYFSKQLETTFHQFCEKLLHITFKVIPIGAIWLATWFPISLPL